MKKILTLVFIILVFPFKLLFDLVCNLLISVFLSFKGMFEWADITLNHNDN